jgi:hypothetical protein
MESGSAAGDSGGGREQVDGMTVSCLRTQAREVVTGQGRNSTALIQGQQFTKELRDSAPQDP